MHPLKEKILDKYNSVEEFAYINDLDKGTLYKIFRNNNVHYMHGKTILNISIGLNITKKEVRELCHI